MECVYKQAEQNGTASSLWPLCGAGPPPAIPRGAASTCIAANASTHLEARSEMMVLQAETLEKNMELAARRLSRNLRKSSGAAVLFGPGAGIGADRLKSAGTIQS